MICRVHKCWNCGNSICKPQSIIFNDCENQCVKRLNATFTTKYLTLVTENNLIFPNQSVFSPGALTLGMVYKVWYEGWLLKLNGNVFLGNFWNFNVILFIFENSE